ncbi:bacilysin biosynthesis oxidoreductase bacC [Trichodelitschia bisporula]|uniref:Bacilysin biosynthesis oxidoreductase bacC n=1 Tax=Trichodelitschia bisporula TaxID=703511 RepID=A0A6G1HJA0_9PEZI|nr:bacilysin biosynthesis oxidoreductase bacC [Trichodelitschia bisporula]
MPLLPSYTAIVTGGASGLGLTISRALLAEGANVIIADVNPSALESCPAALDAVDSPTLLTLRCDVSSDTDVASAVEQAVTKYGRIDILINNAAINDAMAPVGDCPREMWDKNLLVNVTGPYLTSQACVRQFLAQEARDDGTRGVIVNIISAAGIRGHRAGAAYTASKHALVGLTRNTAAFYGPKGIRAVGVLPGAMETGMGGEGRKREYHAEGVALVGKTFATETPWNKVEEVARLCVLLASPGVGTVNGSLVGADNGWTAI